MIENFKSEEYSWLSNFAPVSIKLDDNIFSSVENAYQSKKSNDINWINLCIQEQNPAKIKTLSNKIDKINNWNKIKIDIMRECINQKFEQEPYKTLLINTKNEYIQEGNWWNDTFWGVDITKDPPVGKNMLGKIIMEKRLNIQSSNLL